MRNDLEIGANQNQWNVSCESREKLYRTWRIDTTRKIGAVQNIDQLEYTIKDGKIIPVALIELSKAENPIRNWVAYTNKIDSTKARQLQMKVVQSIAEMLGVLAFYLVFDDTFDRFYVKGLKNGKWKEYTPKEWNKALKILHERAKK